MEPQDETRPPVAPRLRFLLDTNVCIATEPYDGTLPENNASGSRLLQLIAKQRHDAFVHPAVRDDLARNHDDAKRAQRLAELNKFQMLGEGTIPTTLTDLVGPSDPGSNSHRDLRLLAALFNRAVTHLVSDDMRLLRRARRANLPVLSLTEAVQLLEELGPTEFVPPPRVERIESYQIDREDRIFKTLAADYGAEEFDAWLFKVQSESDFRPCFEIREDNRYAGIAILKYELDCNYDFPAPVLKLSTFKVATSYAGSRYGELLLKSIFAFAREQNQSSLYVGVFPKHGQLVAMLEDFGFLPTNETTENVGEQVLLKKLKPTQQDGAVADGLRHHIVYGPPAIGFSYPHEVWVIPIRPVWHDQLFPDWPGRQEERQLALPGILADEPKPWGNALRKAYLCNANLDKIRPGDTVLFYRSSDERAVTAVGVVEQAFRTGDPDEALAAVGGRTVYSPMDIARMCEHHRGLLAILFRQDRFVEPGWPLEVLEREDVLRGPPQTIGRVREGGISWVRTRLGA